MSPELFHRWGESPRAPSGKDRDCLSAWQVSQVALGLLTGAAAVHSQSCDVCIERLHAEATQQEAAVFERVPSVLVARSGKTSWLGRLWPSRRRLMVLA